MDNKTNEKMKNTVTENFEKKENVVNEGFTTAPKRGVAGIGYKILIQHEILDWIADVPFSKFYNEISKDVIGQEALKQVCANVYAYLNKFKVFSSFKSIFLISISMLSFFISLIIFDIVFKFLIARKSIFKSPKLSI